MVEVRLPKCKGLSRTDCLHFVYERLSGQRYMDRYLLTVLLLSSPRTGDAIMALRQVCTAEASSCRVVLTEQHRLISMYWGSPRFSDHLSFLFSPKGRLRHHHAVWAGQQLGTRGRGWGVARCPVIGPAPRSADSWARPGRLACHTRLVSQGGHLVPQLLDRTVRSTYKR